MTEKSKGVNLGRYWPLWGLHFGFHIMIGLFSSMAGLVVIFSVGQLLNGLALVGAGFFALLNGWQGVKELRNNHVNKKRRYSQENNG